MSVPAILLCAAFALGCNVEADFSDHLESEILSAEADQQEIAGIDRRLFPTIAAVSMRVSEHDPKSRFLIGTTAPARSSERRDTLTGKWQVTAMFANGEPRRDDEVDGSIWSFDPPRLTIRDGRGKETGFHFKVDGGYLEVTQPDGDRGWMKYELRGTEELRVAFFDGLGAKPPGFEADPNRKDPMLVVVHLTAIR